MNFNQNKILGCNSISISKMLPTNYAQIDRFKHVTSKRLGISSHISLFFPFYILRIFMSIPRRKAIAIENLIMVTTEYDI